MARVRDEDREIVRLAVPAFLALVAEPLFLLSDSAIVGHLGTEPLAGLGIASVVMQTAVGLCIFLAYGTTASVARRLGAGNLPGALRQGIDGLWLAVLIGAVATVAGVALTGPLVAAFGPEPAVGDQAVSYLRIAFLGTTPLLLMLAATGVLRGLQDTRTPLYVAVGGNTLNVVLNVVLVYGLGPVPALGIAGSAVGSVISQVASAAALGVVVIRAARHHRAPLAPDLAGIRAAGRAGLPLFVRTLVLRAALLATTYAVTLLSVGRAQAVDLATHQLAMTVWGFLAFALDAIAIAAQALLGKSLGAGDLAATRALTRRMMQWGVASGVVTGSLLALASPLLGPLFSGDRAVHEALVPVLLVAALGQPLAGLVFVLDGVLIGAGDGPYLARSGLVVLAVYLPALFGLALLGGTLVLVWVAVAFGLMGARGVVLVHRARGDAWLVAGESREAARA